MTSGKTTWVSKGSVNCEGQPQSIRHPHRLTVCCQRHMDIVLVFLLAEEMYALQSLPAERELAVPLTRGVGQNEQQVDRCTNNAPPRFSQEKRRGRNRCDRVVIQVLPFDLHLFIPCSVLLTPARGRFKLASR